MAYTPALVQRLFPSRSIVREIVVVSLGALAVAALAQVSIGFRPVPVTGQTLGVLLVGASLGFRRGCAATIAYLGAGVAGLPIFSGFGAGVGVLVGPTGGYLIGFVFSAGTIGLLAEHGFLRSYPRTLLAMVLATIPVFVVGLAWLLNFIPPDAALKSGLLIFLPGAGIKIALATLLVGRTGRVASAPIDGATRWSL